MGTSKTARLFNIGAAKKDPTRYFDSSDEVVGAIGLSDGEKLEILRH